MYFQGFPFELQLANYSRTPLMGTNWDGEPSGYAQNTDYFNFL
jgi:hypothetical protein